ncbi:MAG: dTMP kinase [Erythrobacter sp.]
MSEPTKTGRFIALEGGEGAGKSTQAALLRDALLQNGQEVVLTREPGGTRGAEAIRNLLLDPPMAEGWGAEAEALLFAAARSDHVSKRIKPAMERGAWVICDRFVDSSRAYQGGAGKLGDEIIQSLHQIGSDGIRPDLTLLFELDEERMVERLAQRDGDQSDAIGGRGREYHRAVAAQFRVLADADPAGFALVDANGSADQVHQLVWAAINPLLGGV